MISKFVLNNFIKLQFRLHLQPQPHHLVQSLTLINRYQYNNQQLNRFYSNKYLANSIFTDYQNTKNNKTLDFQMYLTYMKRLYITWKHQRFDLQDHRWIEIEYIIFQNFDTDKISLYDKILFCDFYRHIDSQKKYEKTIEILRKHLHQMDINLLCHYIFCQKGQKTNTKLRHEIIIKLQRLLIQKLSQKNGQNQIKIRIVSIQDEDKLSYEEIKNALDLVKTDESQNLITKKAFTRLLVSFYTFTQYNHFRISYKMKSILTQTLCNPKNFYQNYPQGQRADIIIKTSLIGLRLSQWKLLLPYTKHITKDYPKDLFKSKSLYQLSIRIRSIEKTLIRSKAILKNQDNDQSIDQSYIENLKQVIKKIDSYLLQIAMYYTKQGIHQKNHFVNKYLNSLIFQCLVLVNQYNEKLFHTILSDIMVNIKYYQVICLLNCYVVLHRIKQSHNIEFKNQKEVLQQWMWKIYPDLPQSKQIQFHNFRNRKSTFFNETIQQGLKHIYDQNQLKLFSNKKKFYGKKLFIKESEIKLQNQEEQQEDFIIQETFEQQNKTKGVFGRNKKVSKPLNEESDDVLFQRANGLLDQEQIQDIKGEDEKDEKVKKHLKQKINKKNKRAYQNKLKNTNQQKTNGSGIFRSVSKKENKTQSNSQSVNKDSNDSQNKIQTQNLENSIYKPVKQKKSYRRVKKDLLSSINQGQEKIKQSSLFSKKENKTQNQINLKNQNKDSNDFQNKKQVQDLEDSFQKPVIQKKPSRRVKKNLLKNNQQKMNDSSSFSNQNKNKTQTSTYSAEKSFNNDQQNKNFDPFNLKEYYQSQLIKKEDPFNLRRDSNKILEEQKKSTYSSKRSYQNYQKTPIKVKEILESQKFIVPQKKNYNNIKQKSYQSYFSYQKTPKKIRDLRKNQKVRIQEQNKVIKDEDPFNLKEYYQSLLIKKQNPFNLRRDSNKLLQEQKKSAHSSKKSNQNYQKTPTKVKYILESQKVIVPQQKKYNNIKSKSYFNDQRTPTKIRNIRKNQKFIIQQQSKVIKNDDPFNLRRDFKQKMEELKKGYYNSKRSYLKKNYSWTSKKIKDIIYKKKYNIIRSKSHENYYNQKTPTKIKDIQENQKFITRQQKQSNDIKHSPIKVQPNQQKSIYSRYSKKLKNIFKD